MKKLIIYVDMDNTIADFHGSLENKYIGVEDTPLEMMRDGFFRNLQVIPEAAHYLRHLHEQGHNVVIASKPTTKNLKCASEKYEWVQEHFPYLLGKMILIFDKALLAGDALVDDQVERWEGFQGAKIKIDRLDFANSWKQAYEELQRIANC
jgi:5'(3')-deoxyribonucleotidase